MAQEHQNASTVAHVVLPGSRRTPLANSRLAGPIDPAEIASLTVRTRSAGDPAKLKAHVDALYAKKLAERSYLSKDELARQFGADPADLDAIEQFAQTHQLTVVHRNPAERSVVLRGALSDLLSAFPADVHMYHHASGTYRGRRGEILIPKQFGGIITGIYGYDTRPKHRRPHRGLGLATRLANGGNGFPATEFAKRYNFPTAANGQTLDGAGQCIGIIELGGGFRTADLKTYFGEIGVKPPRVVSVSVDHGRNKPTATGGADGEVMLDIEVAGAVAPGALFAIYFAPNQGSGFLDAINAAVHDTHRNPSVISISWGGPEDPGDSQSAQAFHEIFVEAAALGITICAAAGDHGVADLDSSQWDGKIHVDHPAVDDMVLACGGTQFDPGGPDVVWNDGTKFDVNMPGGGGWATGGGVSTTVALPAYQKDAGVPDSLDTGKIGRGVPDIAMSATQYWVRFHGTDQPSGGTSAVAPLMASLIALLNQAKGKKVGFLNPFLYANPNLCKDVTRGDNGIAGMIGGYSAKSGWDACTGLGTPDGTAILNAL